MEALVGLPLKGLVMEALRRDDVRRLGSLCALFKIELDCLSDFQRVEVPVRACAVVEEDIRRVFHLDKTESFIRFRLDRACRHG